MLVENLHRLSRTFLFLLMTFCLGFPLVSFAQTEIGGIINTYTRVTGQGSCPNLIQVEDTQGFTVGQTVLLIGMQGAEMSIEDNGTFGQVSSEGLTAGLYDWTRIEAIQGNMITLVHSVSGDYDTGRLVQLVGVPTYDDVTVVSELTPMPWDGNLGGVLAIEVTGALTLAADISATGMGFRGGQSVLADDNCTLLTSANKYYYESGNWRGAPKGEGIVPLVNGRELGRGPQANGGGGSNTHNSGGGGGSNRSQGGVGGENREPSFGGCDGLFPGLGGVPLNFGAERLFMGGGGGAGHRNNTNMSSGGNGGGIIVIKSETLTFNSGTIRSDGMGAETVTGDGAGGGGAGGTIVLDVANLNGTPVVSAQGGKGGDVANSSNRCMGPGGGGSGGVVYSTIAMGPNLEGGAAGLSKGNQGCPEGPNGSLPGEAGTMEMVGLKTPGLPAELQLSAISSDTTICPGDPLVLSALLEPIDFEVNYQWLINEDGNWVNLTDGAGFSGTNTADLQISSLLGAATFQLRMSTACTEPLVSEAIQVSLASSEDLMANFLYELDGFTATFMNQSAGASDFEWTIDEIPFYSSNDPEPEFTFPGNGSYTVNLVAGNNCAQDSVAQVIAIGGAPVANFRGESSGSRCVPVSIQWMDESQGIFDTYKWSFPGGTPSTSVEPNPVVVYDKPGEYDVMLTVTGELGSNTRTREKIVKVFSSPQPAFSYMINGLKVDFTSTADAAMVHVWSFGDGNTSNEKDPVHTFAAPGAYDVTLNLQNGGCASSITQTVLVFTTDVDHHELSPYLRLYPNPTFGPLRLDSNTADLFPLDLYLFNLKGQLLEQVKMDRPKALDLSPYSSGVYFILARSPLGIGSWRIVKQ